MLDRATRGSIEVDASDTGLLERCKDRCFDQAKQLRVGLRVIDRGDRLVLDRRLRTNPAIEPVLEGRELVRVVARLVQYSNRLEHRVAAAQQIGNGAGRLAKRAVGLFARGVLEVPLGDPSHEGGAGLGRLSLGASGHSGKGTELAKKHKKQLGSDRKLMIGPGFARGRTRLGVQKRHF